MTEAQSLTEPATEANPSEDLRTAKRQRVLKSAKIVLDDWRVVDCTVRDLSESGVKLLVSSNLNLPDKFRLLMTAEHTIRPVEVAWKGIDMIGVAFLGPAEKAPLRKFKPAVR